MLGFGSRIGGLHWHDRCLTCRRTTGTRILIMGLHIFVCSFFSFFFFQAEDGIRDLIVTGVQTCALPISAVHRACLAARSSPGPVTEGVRGRLPGPDDPVPGGSMVLALTGSDSNPPTAAGKSPARGALPTRDRKSVV